MLLWHEVVTVSERTSSIADEAVRAPGGPPPTHAYAHPHTHTHTHTPTHPHTHTHIGSRFGPEIGGGVAPGARRPDGAGSQGLHSPKDDHDNNNNYYYYYYHYYY